MNSAAPDSSNAATDKSSGTLNPASCNPRSRLRHDDLERFGPRIGFAYDLTGKGTSLVRSRFGMMHESSQGNDMYNAGANQPFSSNVTLNNLSLSNPRLNV